MIEIDDDHSGFTEISRRLGFARGRQIDLQTFQAGSRDDFDGLLAVLVLTKQEGDAFLAWLANPEMNQITIASPFSGTNDAEAGGTA